MSSLVSDAIVKMRSVDGAVSDSGNKSVGQDMNSLHRSSSAPPRTLSRQSNAFDPEKLATPPIKPKRPSALNVTLDHRNSLVDTEMPRTPVTTALFDVFDSPSPDVLSSKEADDNGGDDHDLDDDDDDDVSKVVLLS